MNCKMPIGPDAVQHLRAIKRTEDEIVPNDALLVFLAAIAKCDKAVGVTWQDLRDDLDVPNDVAQRAITLLAIRRAVKRCKHNQNAWIITEHGEALCSMI